MWLVSSSTATAATPTWESHVTRSDSCRTSEVAESWGKFKIADSTSDQRRPQSCRPSRAQSCPESKRAFSTSNQQPLEQRPLSDPRPRPRPSTPAEVYKSPLPPPPKRLPLQDEQRPSPFPRSRLRPLIPAEAYKPPPPPPSKTMPLLDEQRPLPFPNRRRRPLTPAEAFESPPPPPPKRPPLLDEQRPSPFPNLRRRLLIPAVAYKPPPPRPPKKLSLLDELFPEDAWSLSHRPLGRHRKRLPLPDVVEQVEQTTQETYDYYIWKKNSSVPLIERYVRASQTRVELLERERQREANEWGVYRSYTLQ